MHCSYVCNYNCVLFYLITISARHHGTNSFSLDKVGLDTVVLDTVVLDTVVLDTVVLDTVGYDPHYI